MNMNFTLNGTECERLRDELLAAEHPSGDLFRKVAKRCIAPRGSRRLPDGFSAALDKGAYVEAAHTLLATVHPGAGYMLGLLPTGSAHVRLMLGEGWRVRPVDSFREDGQLALAVLDVLLSASAPQYTQ